MRISSASSGATKLIGPSMLGAARTYGMCLPGDSYPELVLLCRPVESTESGVTRGDLGASWCMMFPLEW